MRPRFYHTLPVVMTIAFAAGMWMGTAFAAPSLSQPGEDIRELAPQAQAALENQQPALEAAPEAHFNIASVRLDAQELKLDKATLTEILSESVGVDTTLSAFNETLSKVTAYCRAHGYPAAAAFLPAQDSADGTVLIKVIPGRYGKVHIDNKSRLKKDIIEGFLRGLREGDIIRTSSLETALYSISNLSGTKAIGVLSPGADFGTSDLTVRVEDGKQSNTVLYAENYGSKSSGRYRYGLQESLYNVGGTGGKINVGALISNSNLHNYYVNYETLVGRGGTKLGIGYSRMDYTLGGLGRQTGSNGTADTISLFGSRPIYHLDNRRLEWRFGYDYRKLKDDFDVFGISLKKHSHSAHLGLEGYNRWPGTAVSYNATLTTGTIGGDSDRARQQLQLGRKDGRYTKLEASVTGVQVLGHQTDLMMKLSAQMASRNLDSSEQLYLGGANAVRAYPQGEGSGDKGALGTLELRYHTNLPGLTLSAYLDGGHTFDGVENSSMTLKGWGLGVSYTKPEDWFARLDYARRIGGDENMSRDAKAKGRLWFILGKIW